MPRALSSCARATQFWQSLRRTSITLSEPASGIGGSLCTCSRSRPNYPTGFRLFHTPVPSVIAFASLPIKHPTKSHAVATAVAFVFARNAILATSPPHLDHTNRGRQWNRRKPVHFSPPSSRQTHRLPPIPHPFSPKRILERRKSRQHCVRNFRENLPRQIPL